MTDPKAKSGQTRLDWSKLLGFDQTTKVDHSDLQLTDLGFSKIGAKRCNGVPVTPPPT